MEEDSSLVKTEEIIQEAREWIGTPYHHQASVKGVGCDCIGLVRGIFRELYHYEVAENINYSSDWGDSNGNEDIINAGFKYMDAVPLEEMAPGDMVAVRWAKKRVAKHVMILSGNGKAIHAYNNAPVTEIHLNDWWRRRIVYAFRFPQEVN